MTRKPAWYEEVTTPALLRHARTTYGSAMRRALADAGYDDIPRNGLYLIGGMAFHEGDMPLGNLVRDLRVSKQAAGQLVDTLVTRGYLQRDVDEQDRRKLTVMLTDRGREAASVQTDARKKIDADLLAHAGKGNVAITRKTLAALVEIGRRQEDDHDDA
ncbi:MAG: MarR family transcriptional regulator [Rhodanobacter sp.]